MLLEKGRDLVTISPLPQRPLWALWAVGSPKHCITHPHQKQWEVQPSAGCLTLLHPRVTRSP